MPVSDPASKEKSAESADSAMGDVYEMWIEACESKLNASITVTSSPKKPAEESVPLGSDEYFYTSL